MTMTSTSSAHLSVSGFLGFRAGDLPRIEGAGDVFVPVGTEGSVIRFEAESGRDLLARWVVLEPGHRYRAEPSPCAGVRFRDLARTKDARRPFVQVDASLLAGAKFPVSILGADGTELDSIGWADVGPTTEAQLDPACADSGARVRVKDAAGTSLLDVHLVIPYERVTRVTLQPDGGFTAAAFDAHYIYFREEANRVDAVTLDGLRIEGKPSGVRHEHGGAGARIELVIFEVKNTAKTPRTLAAKSAEMVREHSGREAKVRGVSRATDESKYSAGEEPAPAVTIAPGETAFVRVHVEPIEVYLASINSTHRWHVAFASGGKTVTATVPQPVMRMERYRPRDDGE